ncbi:putative F-box-like domain superfamily protein [Septoria linicola]|nr:putative F-box-like domain superfamily protein [Septoria linicola]
MTTAADRALNVAELLERILLQLPMKDILLDQRVAKFWRDLVKSSPKLQQALFYRPDYEVETWTAVNWEIDSRDDASTVVEAVTPGVHDQSEIPHDTLVVGTRQRIVIGVP